MPKNEPAAALFYDLAEEGAALLQTAPGNYHTAELCAENALHYFTAGRWIVSLFRLAARNRQDVSLALVKVIPKQNMGRCAQGWLNPQTNEVEYRDLGPSHGWTTRNCSEEDFDLPAGATYNLQCNPFSASVQFVNWILSPKSADSRRPLKMAFEGKRSTSHATNEPTMTAKAIGKLLDIHPDTVKDYAVQAGIWVSGMKYTQSAADAVFRQYLATGSRDYVKDNCRRLIGNSHAN